MLIEPASARFGFAPHSLFSEIAVSSKSVS